jgi:hypothetical protein
MPELPRLLTDAADAAEDLRTAEAEAEEMLAEAREKFREALEAARAAGASNALLGRVVGLSRQRVAQVLKGK